MISCIVGVTGLLFVAWFGLSPREVSESARDELLVDGDDGALAVEGGSVRDSEDDEEQRRSTDYLLGGSSGGRRA